MMRAALALARRSLGRTWPNPAVGCVIVKDGAIVGRGRTRDGGRPHAEADALAQAGEAARGATVYVTLEPCSHFGKSPPCADALVAPASRRSCRRWRIPTRGERPGPRPSEGGGHRRRSRRGREGSGRDQRGIPDAGGRRPAALSSQDGDLARWAHRDGLGRKQMDHRRGRSRRWPASARHPRAILVGANTVAADDPELTCRLPGLERYSPIRIVLDSKGAPVARLETCSVGQ